MIIANTIFARIVEAARGRARRLGSDEEGQATIFIVVVMLTVLCVGALCVDLVFAMDVQRQLQVSADAAALAAAETIDGTSTGYLTSGSNYSAASNRKNNYYGNGVAVQSVKGLCLQTVSNWGAPCSTNPLSPNAVQVTETATLNTFFAQIFGVKQIKLSATSTAAAKGATPLPYNVAIIVDSTLSMNSSDPNCNWETQEQCALNGVQQLLLSLWPTDDHVALFTFPNVAAGSRAGIEKSGRWGCTSPIPWQWDNYGYGSSGNQGTSMLTLMGSGGYDGWGWGGYGGGGSNIGNDPPYSGAPWDLPYTFPAKPTSASGYGAPAGTLGATYQLTQFSTDYRTSDTASELNSSSALVQATGAVGGCGGTEPGNYDGNYGTYYAGAIYAAQAALLQEQTSNPGSQNVIIILGDGNSTAPDPATERKFFYGLNYNSPGMPTTTAQETTTYKSTSSVTTTAYTYPSAWMVADNSGNYPSYVGECGQAVDAALYASNYPNNPTKVYTVAYGSSTQSLSRYQDPTRNGNCASDINAGSHPNITPCQTMQRMASNSTATTTSGYFYSDYYAPGGDDGCQAPDKNNTITSLNDIFKSIATSLTRVRLIPNGLT